VPTRDELDDGYPPPIPRGMTEEALLEQVFDKTITQEDIEAQQQAQANNKDDNHGSKELFDDSKIELKTELSPVETVAIARLRFMANRYDIPAFRVFTDDIMKLKVSNRRQGRKEFIQGLHAEEKRQQQAQQGGTPMDWILGKLGMGGGDTQ